MPYNSVTINQSERALYRPQAKAMSSNQLIKIKSNLLLLKWFAIVHILNLPEV